MSKIEHTGVVTVFTSKGTETLKKDGGSGSWRLDNKRLLKQTYCLCVQNRHDKRKWLARLAEHQHGQPFMIGRGLGVVPVPKQQDDLHQRYLITFAEYAILNCDICDSFHRNPVNYQRTLANIGIDPDKLNWQPMPPATTSIAAILPEDIDDPAIEAEAGGLTMAQARAGLAIGLGVPESNIEITVRY
jgi:hypothetical protein